MRVHFVLPDAQHPSGGNAYDAHAAAGLSALGFDVREVAVAGTWPRPDEAARARLSDVLAAVADGGAVLLDGLVACGVPEVVGAHAGRLRIAVLVHLPLADETGLNPDEAAMLDAAERRTLRAADLVISTSPQAAQRLVDHHGLHPDRVRTAAPGTEPAPLSPGTDGVSRILCVASVTPRKGHDVLLEALAGTSLTCDVVGPQPDPATLDLLRALIEQHGLGRRVTLRGPLTGADLGDAYAAADLLVHPSRAETYGMAVTEALARGIPVMASATPDALGDGGLLLPPGDPGALAEALHRWVGDPGFRSGMRAAARRRREELQTWSANARQLGAALASLEA
ncbi:glycosyltransferase family 4 protein [Saccharopolyspora dendranthemae]|uniref:Glycosyl transferase family 4 n=1 Tax=Saccharopolyspora dendranthemae TaxID=1181886 RepID=A0A561V8M1_9PSEU|nr:glycosyltransferase family 4 protein [Saccharopolyspora dendranthemae]TWG07950.1 glycosyl transferase family 4 [Saccharopolyspora dendranthemae]